jgi:hypothetical protein
MRARRLVIVLVGLADCVLLLALYNIRKSHSIDDAVTAPASAVSAASRALRPNYPYSVIVGGAYSPAELRYAQEKDRSVREHYADFDLRAARLVTLTQDRDQYVSFRQQNRIYWTWNKLRIPQGEILLTDGRNYARTRCGNRLSSTPMANTTQHEPSSRALSLPPFRPELLSAGQIQLASAAPKGELEQNLPVLPFEMPTLAPYVPAFAENIIQAPPKLSATESDPPIVPGGLGYIPAATLSVSGAPESPTLASVLVSSPPSFVSEVPEPASLYLFGFASCVSSWCLIRMMRPGAASQDIRIADQNGSSP